MSNTFTLKEFKDRCISDEVECEFLWNDLKEVLGKNKVVWLSVEGDISKAERFEYDVVETICETSNVIKEWDSVEGEEVYKLYNSDKGIVEILKDTPTSFEIPKKFNIIEINIPGMTDYVITY